MNIFTAAKVSALVGLILAVVFSGKGSKANLMPLWPDQWTGEMTVGLSLSMISVPWAYDGRITITLTAGEFKDPRRNLPISLIAGTLAAIALYAAANLAYAWILPLPEVAASPRIAADVAGAVLGPLGATLMVAGILGSTFGTIHGCILGGPRCLYAAGTDGTFSRRFGRVHPPFHTPAAAIVTLGAWGALLTLSGTYDQITSYVESGSWGFYALTAVSVIVLRRKMPMPRSRTRHGDTPMPHCCSSPLLVGFSITLCCVIREMR